MSDDLTFRLARSVELMEEDPKVAKAAFHEAAKAATPPCPSCGKRIVHRKGVSWCYDHEMSEKTLQDRVVDRAKRRGWRVAHAGRGWIGGSEAEGGQWVTPMAPGWPDLTLAKAGHRLIFMELKRETGELSPEQVDWLALLNRCGTAAIIVRPSDLREGRVNAILDYGDPLDA